MVTSSVSPPLTQRVYKSKLKAQHNEGANEMTKIKASEVTTGQTVKANMMTGSHVVAEIRTGYMKVRGGVTAETVELYNAEGKLFFIGRLYAKATIV